MKCPKCQTDNRDEAKFCLKCREKFEHTCPQCGRTMPLIAVFCDECGSDLTISSPTSSPPVELSFEEKLENIQRYLPGGLTEKILSQKGKIEGERKQVTVMFCDTEGFSTLSEKLGPEKVYSIMDEVFEMLIHKVNEFGGTVNKMTGDGVMALFGAPIALEDAPQRAIRSALAIQREIARFSDRIKGETGAPLRMRIGIHTGPVVVGTLGNDLRVEFTAVGDTVNLASRMEGLAESGTVYVTEETFKFTEGLFRFEALGEREVKGKEAPVKAYRVIAPSTRRTRFDVSAERGLTPFLGRERELELLIDGLDRAKSGRGQAFSIMGEAGVGKSRLLYEFRKAIANEDVTFIEGRCLSYSTNVAYHPIIDLLKSTYEIHEGDPDDRIKEKVKRGLKEQEVDQASTLPFVLEMLSVKESGIDALNLSPEARKDKTLEALRRIVLKGSEIRPLVVAVEDLHWVDKSSEEVFKDMLDAISGAQLLLIFTYRPEFVQTWGGKSYHNQVNLNRLSNRETLAMASYILGTEIIGEDLEELILNKTEGIPFFVEEFMKSLKDLRMIEWKESGYYLAKDISEVAIPSTIQEVIMARVDSLPDGAKSVLQTGSAIGREFSCELIKRVTGIPTREMTPHLSVLRDSELLYERGIFPQATYIFRHSLTQEVAYDSLLLKRRKEIHQRIGEAIEYLYPDRLEDFYETLAFHYKQGESLDKAIDYLIKAGEKSYNRYAGEEAHQYCKEAYDILSNKPSRTKEEDVLLIDLLFKWGFVFGWRGDWRGLTDVYSANQELVESLSDKAWLASFYGAFGYAMRFRAKLNDSYQYLNKALKLGEESGDQQVIGYICAFISLTCAELGLLDEAIAYGERAREISRSLESDYDLHIHSLVGIGNAYACKGEVKKAFAASEDLLEYGRRHASIRVLACGHLFTAIYYNVDGDYSSAIECAKQAIEVSADPIITKTSRWVLGMIYTMNGQFQEAKDAFQEVITFSEQFGVELFGTISNLYLGVISIVEGRMDQGLKMIEETQRSLLENGMKTQYARSCLLMGMIYIQMAENAEVAKLTTAKNNFNKAIEVAREIGAKGLMGTAYLGLGLLHQAKVEKARARECTSAAIDLFEQCELENMLRRAREALASLE